MQTPLSQEEREEVEALVLDILGRYDDEEEDDDASGLDVTEIGKWTLRVVLAIGAIVGFLMGNETVGGGCVSGIFATFWFLD